MKSALYVLLMFTLFVGEVLWTAWQDSDAPVARLPWTAVYIEDGFSTRASNANRDWSRANPTLEAILASAVWPRGKACSESGCTNAMSSDSRRL